MICQNLVSWLWSENYYGGQLELYKIIPFLLVEYDCDYCMYVYVYMGVE